MWFGNTEYALEIKSPLTEMPNTPAQYNNVQALQRGGAAVRQSFGEAKNYAFQATGTEDQMQVYQDFRIGLHGTGLIRWIFPSSKTRNMFPPNWAAPKLIEVENNGWPDIVDNAAQSAATSFVTTAANTQNLPNLSSVHTLGATVSVVPTKMTTLLIPTNNALRLVHVGAASTSTCGWYYRGILPNGSYDTITRIPPAAVGSTLTGVTIAANTYTAIQIFAYNTVAGTPTLTTAALMAQMGAATPAVPTSFFSGRGVSGCSFVGPLVQTISRDAYTGETYYKISGVLQEVEQWQRAS